MSSKNEVIEKLKSMPGEFANVVPFDLNQSNAVVFNLTESNEELKKFDVIDTQQLTKYIFDTLDNNDSPVGYGGYNEDRFIYKRSKVFNSGEEPRTIHLGIDIWAKAGTEIYSPLPANVHSFKNNATFGDYGPTIILEHNIKEVIFYTLYGHLSIPSLLNLFEGKEIKRGEKIATLGSPEENVQWPPHLHFQIITDMLDKKGDFPGVAEKSKRDYYLNLCPDPNLILNIDALR